MKKLIFAVLCFLSTNAYCAWYNVDKSAVVKSYINIESIRPAGNFYEAWILYDLKQPLISQDHKKVKSVVRLEVFDCVNRANAKEQSTYYSGSMGKGEAVETDNPSNPQWNPVIPGSRGETVMQVVCAYAE